MPDTPVSNLPEFSVTELSAALKRTVEDQFAMVRVRGEISGLKFHSSGHVYFDLKDDKAVLNAVIWRGVTSRLRIRPEAGMEVICTGKLSTYAGSSRYQIIVEQVELAGLGALMAMLEERRKKLAAEGLFDAARKKKLPFLPEVIGVITSPTGAVIRDIMHRLEARFPRRVLLWPVAVQGEKAAAEIAAAITGFNAFGAHLPKPDLIIVARGGGSVEDLMAFNDEAVVRAVAAGVIPLISAVGHETDTTLIDFVSDVRAPTPTAAAELAVPVRTELLATTLDYERRMLTCFSKGLKDRQRHLAQLARVLPRADSLFAGPRQRLDQAGERLGQSLRKNLQVHRVQFSRAEAQLRDRMLKDRMTVCGERVKALATRAGRAQTARLAQARKYLDGLARVLDSVSHKSVLERGFALVRGEDGKVRRRASAITSGESLTLTFADGDKQAVAEGGPARPKGKKPVDQGSLF
ncbi:MAG: exodeoxyribonuclease VII large subunit [Alphaproteobacteria bacterium]|nr:exodeoxyribonuclease VII large subunit [Alphaproteobacteria bacterium]